MTLARRAVRSVVGLGILDVVRYIASFIFQIVFARLLTPEIFGEVALASAILTFLTILGRWGVSEALMQENDHKEVLSTIFWLRLGFTLISLIVIALFSFVVQYFYSQSVAIVLLILAVSKGFMMVSAPVRAEIQKEFKLPQLGALSFLSLLVGAAIGLYFVHIGYGLVGLAVYYGMREMLLAISVFLITPEYPSLSYDRETASWFVGFAKDMFKSQSLNAVEGSGDDYLVGTLGTATALGAYSVSWRLASAFRTMFQTSINKGILPTFSRLKGSEKHSREGIAFLLRTQLYIAVPGYIFAALAAEEMILLTLGPDWVSAVPVFRLLTIAGVLFPLLGTVRQFYYARGDSTTVLGIQKYYIFIMFVGMGALVPNYGARGAAVAIDLMNVVGLILFLRRLGRDLNIHAIRLFAPVAIAGTVSLSAGAIVKVTGAMTFIQTQIATLSVYAVITALTFYSILYIIDQGTLHQDFAVFKRAMIE